MEPFRQLGDRVEAEWRTRDYNESDFPWLAGDALRASRIPDSVSPWQVLEWTLEQTELPRQRDVPARFGEPPITVYSGPRFHIDIYFWFHGTTSIHQHGFCGAFQVLQGSSIHSWYDFELRDKVSSFCEIGEMRLRTCELLGVGDVQQILPGRQYIHSLFHLDHPSVTIVIRTDKSPLFLPQFDYHKPGLATDPFFHQDATTKKLQVIGALLTANRPDSDGLIAKLLSESDFHSTYLVLSAVNSRLVSNDLGQMFGQSSSENRFEELLSVAERRHSERAKILRRVFEHRRFNDDLVRRRNFVESAEHRFFLALILNVEGRERILTLINTRFPGHDSIEKVLDWTYELSQMRLAGMGNQNALGITGFDDFDLQLVEYLLRGRSDSEIAAIVREVYPAEKSESLLSGLSERTTAIRGSVVFSPFLSDQE